jgi:hypothetical protein
MEEISWIIAGSLEFKNFRLVGYHESSKFTEDITLFPSLYRKFNLVKNLPRSWAMADLFLSPFDEYMDKLKTDFCSKNSPKVSEERCKIGYVRLANNFFVGICGRYKDAVYIRNLIQYFFNQTLLLTLNKDQPKIIKIEQINRESSRRLFLGYEIRASASLPGRPAKNPELIVPKKLIKEWLISLGLANKEGRGKYMGKWIFLPDAEIIFRFNNVLKNLIEYYKIVNKRKPLHEAVYIIKYSLLHTIAAKHRMSLMQVINKYTLSKNKIGVRKGDYWIIFNES